MACTEVIDPYFVEAILTWSFPISEASVGWYPTAEGIRPSNAETSDPACVNRKILSIKNKIEILVEYGNTDQYSFDDLIQTKDIDRDKLKEIKKETKITDNLKNEDQKDYPSIGNYTINIKYQDQKLKKKVIVKDTTAPVFNEINEVSFEEGSENYDFNQEIKAIDLSNID